MESLTWFFILALLAEILGTVGGFGSSLFFVPLAGFFFDFQTVLGLTALFHLSSNCSKIAVFKNGINKKLILTIGIPALIFVLAGALLTRYFNSKLLELLLAVFLIVIGMVLLIFKNFTIRPTFINSISGGALSGFTAGLLGTGGAIRGLTLAAFNLEKEVFIATSACIDLGIDFSRSLVYFSNGFMHKSQLWLIPVLFVIGFAGTFIGKKLLSYFSQLQFRFITLSLIVITGIITLVKQVYF